MRKLVTIVGILLALCSLPACNADTYDSGYEDGYYEGYNDGYYDGIAKAQTYIASLAEEDLSSLCRDIEKEYGVSPYEAVEILSNYADVPDEVSDESLHNAILAVYNYYCKY